MNSLKLTNRFPSVFANPFVSTSRRGLWRSLIWVVSKIVTWHYPFCTVILSQGKGYCVTVIGGILVRLKNWKTISLQSSDGTFVTHCRAVASGGAGEGAVFVQRVKPISARGADYAHHSTTRPPGFSDLATALHCHVIWKLVSCSQYVSKKNEYFIP